ncbi:MAG: hypothetical protein IKP95_06030 [Ruminococcus sp.]|nr:hypothetical protein [Ruminococcus sp.]
MKKSVYSIVLADDVVSAIDELAYSLGTSRSNLINQILAERVSMMTPEMRMRDIFERIEQLMSGRLLQVAQSGSTAMMLKSPLKYKYRPTVNYSVELTRSFAGAVGRLKVSLRTQSESLASMIGSFFALWVRLENKYLRKLFRDGVPWSGGGVSFVRDFYSPNGSALSDEQIAEAVGGYVSLLDECIRLYFEDSSSADTIEQKYKSYLAKGVMIL